MITISEIAEKAGVNKSTVSRALRNGKGVSEEMRKKILSIANESGYVPRKKKSQLNDDRSKVIGLIVAEIDSNFYSIVVNAIKSRSKEYGYTVVVGQSGFKYEDELHYIEFFSSKEFAGIICELSNGSKIISAAREKNIVINPNTVLINSIIQPPEFDWVGIDCQLGISMVADHLYSLGHKRVGFVSEVRSADYHLNRLRHELESRGMDLENRHVKIGNERYEYGGYLRMKEMLNESELPTAIFASYDTMANGVMKAASEHSIKIPDDISLIGYNNIRESAYYSVPLTTISTPIYEMGTIAVDTLLSRIGSNTPINCTQSIYLRPKFVIRESTKKIE